MRTYADQAPRPSLNPDRDLYWQHNSHWSIRGEHLVGLLVSRYILEHRLVQVPDMRKGSSRSKRNCRNSVDMRLKGGPGPVSPPYPQHIDSAPR